MNTWDRIIPFARQFVRQVDLGREERGYKLKLANGAEGARQQLILGQQQWFETLRKEIGRTSLVNQYFMMSLITVASKQFQELSKVVSDFWIDTPEPNALNKLESNLRRLHERLASGSAIGFGSLLLMSISPTEFPPFRARASGRFMKLVGMEPLDSGASPSDRYGQFLELLDLILEESIAAGLPVQDRLDAQGLMWTIINVDPDASWPAELAAELRAWRGDEFAPTEPRYVRGFGKSPATEDAAWKILAPALNKGPSPLDGATSTWTGQNAKDLLRTRETQDPGTGSYLDRLRAQLEGLPAAVCLLAAELTFLQCIALEKTGGAKKIERISKILSWTPGGPLALRAELQEALMAPGVFDGGQGFNMHIASHVGWLLRLVRHVENLPRSDVEAALNNPWKWMELTVAVPEDNPSIRYTIDYLVWPNYMQPVVVKEHRQRIRDAFSHLLGGSRGNTEIDIAKDLYDIRQMHNAEARHYAEWYREPYHSQWMQGPLRSAKAWLVRQSQDGQPMADLWLEEGIITLSVEGLETSIAEEGFDNVFEAVETAHTQLSSTEQKDKALELHRFATEMSVGDLVISPWQDVILVGRISSEARISGEQGSNLSRTVDWHKDPVDNAGLPDPLPRLLGEPGTVIEVTDALLTITAWAGRPPSPGPDPEPGPAPKLSGAVDLRLKDASDELSTELSIPRDDLQEIISLLRSRRQIVLYGPPGTGKTFIAKKLALYLASKEHADHVQIVQFHPSYAYEDFFEGYRPSAPASGQVGFELLPGPLKQLATEAGRLGNEGLPFFLIIDEMNRGNLAKVFGELYFLLEYRNDSIRLQYNPTIKFALPPNLFIVGTMNTADRSIAMVDAAIRRRFAFVELHPQEGMVKGMLERFLLAEGRSTLAADLLHALNLELGVDKRSLAVGPSYFMKPDSNDAAGLRQVWKYELLPLLEEYHFGELDREEVHERFSLDALLSAIGRSLEELGHDASGDED